MPRQLRPNRQLTTPPGATRDSGFPTAVPAAKISNDLIDGGDRDDGLTGRRTSTPGPEKYQMGIAEEHYISICTFDDQTYFDRLANAGADG